MSVDPYALCPCGSGKKLKFCCSDLVHEIEKIHKMIEGDQPRAALRHVEHTLKKKPNRPSLLDLKATLELTLHQFEAAEQTIATLLEKDPKNPAAHAQQAILQCAQGDARGAVNPLQTALQLIDDSMPRRVLEAIGAVGHALLLEGNVLAARAHLWLYQGVAGDEDNRALELLVRLNQAAGLPLLLREQHYLHEPPAGHPCEDDHNRAQLFAARGQWRRAAQLFDKLCEGYSELATLHYNRALVYSWLGDLERCAAGLHEYACRDVPLDEAVEAEALAQLIDPELKEASVDVVRITYPITDEEEVTARLTRNPGFAPYDVTAEEFESEEGPPPRAAYLLLDRPAVARGEGITREQVPRIVGFISQYGRQTDRAERLELVLDRNEEFDDNRALLETALRDVIGEAESEVAEGPSGAPEQTLSWRWHFPDDTPPKRRRQLLREETRAALLERWPERPRVALEGKTPKEAAGQPGMKVRTLASVLLLEQGTRNQRSPEVFAELRAQLGLPAAGPIDPSGVELDVLPLGRVPRVDLSGASDDELAQLYQRAALAGAAGAVTHVGRELVRRPSLTGRMDVDEVYRRLITLEEDSAKAVQIVDEARRRAEQAGGSSAPWDLMELELHILEGAQEEATRVLDHIRTEHVNEPGVAEHLYELFYALGMIREDGQPMGPSPDATPEPPQSEIWTPDSARQQAPAQKLWTPS